MRLSDHFDTDEFACHCGCGYGSNVDDIDSRLVSLLEDIREDVNRPVKIASGVRCFQHNRSVGGVTSSAHTRGRAADIAICGGAERYSVLSAAVMNGAMGIGVAGTFIHVDVDDADLRRPAAWAY